MPAPARAESSDLAHSGPRLAAATVVAGLLGYAFNLILTRALGPERYGALGALLGVAIIAAVSSTALQLEVARAAARPGGVATRDAMRISAGVALLTGAVVAVSSPLIGGALRLSGPRDTLLLAVLLVPQTLSGGIQGLALGRRRVTAYAVLLVLSAASRLAAAVVTAWVGAGSSFALAAAAVGATVVAVGGLVWLRRSPTLPRSRVRLPPRLWGAGLLRAASGAGALLVLLNVDLLVARSALADRPSGWYAFLTIFGRVTFWGTSFLSLWVFPRVAATGSAQRALRLALVVIAAMGGTAVFVVSVMGEWLVSLLAGSAYAGAEVYAPWFAAIGALLAVVQLAIYVDVARGRHHLSLFVWGAAVVIPGIVLLLRVDSISAIAATTTAVLAVLAAFAVWSIIRDPLGSAELAGEGAP